MLDVRPETPADFDAIRELHAAAFAPSDVEPRLVDRLRADGDHVPELSLVATDDDAVVGHVSSAAPCWASRPAGSSCSPRWP